MVLKRKSVLTRDELREALDTHQISISQIAKATGVPRTYLSEFLSIGRPLKPEQLQQIRDHLEGEGVEFEDAPAPDSRGGNALPPSLAVASICHFPIRPDRVSEAKAVLGKIDENDRRIAELLGETAERKRSWSGDEGEYTEDTDAKLRELFALFGANYVLFRHLTMEKSPLDRDSGDRSIRSAVVEMLKPHFDDAGLRTEPATDTEAAAEPASAAGAA